MDTRSSEQRAVRRRLGLGVATLCASVLTVLWPDWIEGVFHVDPDHGNGQLELVIVLVLAAVSVASFATAWSVRRQVPDS